MSRVILENTFRTWRSKCFQNQPYLISHFALESCFSSMCLCYLATYLVTHVLCGVLFPAEQKPRNNPSIRTVSEVLWNVTVTPWVDCEVWCLVLDRSVTLLAFKKCHFVVLGCFCHCKHMRWFALAAPKLKFLPLFHLPSFVLKEILLNDQSTHLSVIILNCLSITFGIWSDCCD